ncbi:MAG: hypothetical protein HKN35_11300 [Woeseia sp.]|nr:hypothetical protein [Woeseia sp.]NNE61474.1 hypothetical protein [Woeseia sp.]
MRAETQCSVLVLTVALCAGCAVSPEEQNRRQAIDADIEEILSLPLDGEEQGETTRCLSERDYQSFRPLGDKMIVFEGRRDKLWINKLRARCPQLRDGDILITRPINARRMCDTDRFAVADWFDSPWYRRWPWQWGTGQAGEVCVLGNFHPVTEAQVDEIEALLEQR